MDGDSLLNQLFAGLVSTNLKDKTAAKLYTRGSLINVCAAGVLMCPAKADEQLVEGELYKYDDVHDLKRITDVNKLIPSVSLRPDTVELSSDLVSDQDFWEYQFIVLTDPPVGDTAIWVVKPLEEQQTRFQYVCELPIEVPDSFSQIWITPYMFPKTLRRVFSECNADQTNVRTEFMTSVLSSFQIIAMTAGDSFLYFASVARPEDTKWSVQRDGEEYQVDGYDQKTKHYKRLIHKGQSKQKGNKMSRGLPNPIKAVAEAAQENQQTEQPAAAPPWETPTAAPVADRAEPTVTAPAVVEQKPAVSTEAPAQPAEEQHTALQEEQPEPVKRTRTKKEATKIGFNFNSVSEYLNAPVDDFTEADFDKAVEELRSIRELHIAAAKRTMNIVNEMARLTRNSVSLMSTIRECIGKH